MDCKEEILSALKGALKGLGITGVEPLLEHPAEEGHGDYSSNVAMQVGKVPKGWGTPLELASKITAKLNTSSLILNTCSRIEVAPPGFINFWLSEAVLDKELEQALKKRERYGEGDSQARKNYLVEFAHPNTHKLFHIGHLRNITLGECISRLLESQKAKVTRANYQGDIGLHIAKALWGVKTLGFKKPKTLDEKIRFLAKAYVKGNEGYEGDGGARKEIEEINRGLYEGEPEWTELWEETRAWSLEYFDQIYKRVGTKFDRLYFEGEVWEPGRELVLKNMNKVFKKDQGAVIFPGEDYKLHNRVFINSLGLPTYEAKDLGLAELQLKEFSPDKIIHIVGPEQKGYFEVVFKAIEMVFSELKDKEYHLVYGWVRLKEGKMSSRKGEVVEGEWLLDETKKRLKEKYEMPDDVVEQVAVGAVKYSMLRLHPLSEIAFDIDESIRLDGESGPYLQYTFARTQSVLQKAIGTRQWAIEGNKLVPSAQSLVPEELVILRHFYKFPEVVRESAEKFSPNILCDFLFGLAQRYNTFYNKHRILVESRISNLGSRGKTKILNSPGLAKRSGAGKSQTQSFRLALTQVTGNILKTGLNLLGIEAPKKM